MNGITPTFSRYTTHESVINFIKEFQTFCAVKRFDQVRQRLVFSMLLKGATRTIYNKVDAKGEFADANNTIKG